MISDEFALLFIQYEQNHSIKQIEPTVRRCLEISYFQNENGSCDKSEHFYQRIHWKPSFRTKASQKENEEINTLLPSDLKISQSSHQNGVIVWNFRWRHPEIWTLTFDERILMIQKNGSAPQIDNWLYFLSAISSSDCNSISPRDLIQK